MKKTPLNDTFIVFDCAHTDSHNNFNIELVEQLKKIGRVVLLSWNNSYCHLSDDLISVVKRGYLSIGTRNPFLARLILIVNTILNSLYLRSYKGGDPKKYILIGHEIISLGICCFLFPKGAYLIHHMQIDELRSKLKKFFFGLYKKRFVHVVMTEYIKDYLVNCHDIPAENIKLVPHPLYSRSLYSKSLSSIEKTFVALNYSVDEQIIESLISHDLKHSVFAKHGCKVIVKSKSFEYTSSGLRVFNGFLSRSEYDQLYESSDCILSLLNDSF
jgi:hypothetical protein